MDLGTFLSNRRKQLGLSLSDVGSAIGYTPQAIYRYEKGIVKIDLSLVEPFCHVLDLSLASFLKMDPKSIEPYKGEKFNHESFCTILSDELNKDSSPCQSLASKLGTSTTRIEKWANGSSLPSVDEFIDLCNILERDPLELYLGQKKTIVPHHINWKIPLFATMGIVFVSICVALPIALSQNSKSDNPDSSLSSNPITPIRQKCSVVIQGYDYEDHSKIDSIHYEYNVYKGDLLPSFDTNSPYYDYVCSMLNNKEFDYMGTPIEEDTTIQAFYSKKTFTVTFLGYKEETLGISKVRYLSDAIAPTNIEDQGDFRFVSWKEDFTKVKSNLLVHSIFSRFRTNLILEFDGGEEDGDTSKTISGYTSSDFSSLPKPRKKGHEFIGYYDKDGVPFNQSYQMNDGSITLYAKYKPLTYHINFEGISECQDVTYGEKVISLPNQDESNDILLGWEYEGKEVTLPFVYENDFDITLIPIHASRFLNIA